MIIYNKVQQMATKLNKAQRLELMLSIVNTTIDSHTDLFKGGKSSTMAQLLIEELKHQFEPKHGGSSSTKINDKGEVFCNYFQEYLPAEEFATKLSKPDAQTGVRKEVYKANCIRAEKILRKLKNVKAKVISQTTKEFRNKHISEDEFNKVMDALEASIDARYQSVYDVPLVSDLVGLIAAMQTDVKPVRKAK